MYPLGWTGAAATGVEGIEKEGLNSAALADSVNGFAFGFSADDFLGPSPEVFSLSTAASTTGGSGVLALTDWSSVVRAGGGIEVGPVVAATAGLELGALFWDVVGVELEDGFLQDPVELAGCELFPELLRERLRREDEVNDDSTL